MHTNSSGQKWIRVTNDAANTPAAGTKPELDLESHNVVQAIRWAVEHERNSSEPPFHFDPEAPQYSPDEVNDDLEVPFHAWKIEHLEPEPTDPNKYAEWAAAHLRRRPKADLGLPSYRWPAAFFTFYPAAVPQREPDPKYDDDQRIRSPHTLAAVLKFYGVAMASATTKHADKICSQARARAFATYERLATQWYDLLMHGHQPTDSISYEIMRREHRNLYRKHLVRRVGEGVYPADDPDIIRNYRNNQGDSYEDDILPPRDKEGAVEWIRYVRTTLLERCHTHMEHSAQRIKESNGLRNVSHADIVITSLAMRINPPEKPGADRTDPAEPSPGAGEGTGRTETDRTDPAPDQPGTASLSMSKGAVREEGGRPRPHAPIDVPTPATGPIPAPDYPTPKPTRTKRFRHAQPNHPPPKNQRRP